MQKKEKNTRSEKKKKKWRKRKKKTQKNVLEVSKKKKKKRCFSKNRLSHWILWRKKKRRGLTKKKGKSNGRKTISPAVEKIRINLERKKYLSRSVAF